MSSHPFHLAIPVQSIEGSLPFYCDLLGCITGNTEEGRWIDVNFWGNELTLHQAEEKLPTVRHDVEMGAVLVPHFGVHLPTEVYDAIRERIEASSEFDYVDKPYTRFEDDVHQQETFFIKDPSGNVLELKSMSDPENTFMPKQS